MTSDSKLRLVLKYITFMKITERIASLSYDPKHQVGSIIVDKKFSNICAIGYNGNFPGGPNERDSMESGKSGFLHAEENAIIQANLIHPEENILFVTMTPCDMCAKRIARKGIKEIIALKPYGTQENQKVVKNIFGYADINFYYLEDKIFELYTDVTKRNPLYNDTITLINSLSHEENGENISYLFQNLLYTQIDKFFEYNKEPLTKIPAININIKNMGSTPFDIYRKYLVEEYFKAFYTALYNII